MALFERVAQEKTVDKLRVVDAAVVEWEEERDLVWCLRVLGGKIKGDKELVCDGFLLILSEALERRMEG